MPYNKTMIYRKIIENGKLDDFSAFSHFMFIERGLSMFNSGLIYLQRPGALTVHTETQWMKYNRFVLQEATPIIITVPFGPVEFVYDLNDTYGEPYKGIDIHSFIPPAPTRLGDEYLAKAIKTLNRMGIYYSSTDKYGYRLHGRAQLLENPINITYTDDKKGEISIYTHYAIFVNSRLSASDKVKTILHEVGHILCGHIHYDAKTKKIVKTPDRKNDKLSEYMMEYEAESVCEHFCKILGYEHDISKHLSQYHSNDKPTTENNCFILNAIDILIDCWNKS